jgi:hypothetical protein
MRNAGAGKMILLQSPGQFTGSFQPAEVPIWIREAGIPIHAFIVDLEQISGLESAAPGKPHRLLVGQIPDLTSLVKDILPLLVGNFYVYS